MWGPDFCNLIKQMEKKSTPAEKITEGKKDFAECFYTFTSIDWNLVCEKFSGMKNSLTSLKMSR